MAKIERRTGIGVMRGKVDGWVYRSLNGENIVTPYHPKKQKPTAAQTDHRERFRAAQAYAAHVLADPAKRRVYQKLGVDRNRPPNALLISNFLTPPTIESVDLGAESSGPGQVIQIVAADAIEVTAVTVRVLDVDGAVVDSGPAIPDHGVWFYRPGSVATAGSGLRIEATARNRANAQATKVVWSLQPVTIQSGPTGHL